MVCETEQTEQGSVTINFIWVMCVTRVAQRFKSEPHGIISIYLCDAMHFQTRFTLAYLGSRGKLAIFFPRAVRKTCPSFFSTAPSSSKCSTAERTASAINPTGYNYVSTCRNVQRCTGIQDHLTRRRLGHEIKIHHIRNPQSHELQHHTG